MNQEEKLKTRASLVRAIKVAVRLDPKHDLGRLLMTALSEHGVRGDLFDVEDGAMLRALETYIVKLREVEQRRKKQE